MDENNINNEKTTAIFEALRRTDSYILALDQKASFTLAAGITFMGIYATLFYSLIASESNKLNAPLLVAIIGVSLVLWAIWFSKIKAVFSPNVEPSESKSVISFASLTASFNSHEEYYQYFLELNKRDNLDKDIIENHWICSKICMGKVKNFKASLKWLYISLCTSFLGLALVSFFTTFT